LFVGDSTFLNGGIASSNTRIVAILSDDNGIIRSGYLPQNNITATLDDSLSYVLNNYYWPMWETPNAGKVTNPIDDLKAGQHHLSIKVTDTYGNFSSTSITFFVSDVNGIQIEPMAQFFQIPRQHDNVSFQTQPFGDTSKRTVTVYNQLGQPLFSDTYEVLNSPYHVNLPTWDVNRRKTGQN